MTSKEAMEWFKKSAAYHNGYEPFNMAIKALEKQIPKKPILHPFFEDGTDYSYYICPNRCERYSQVNLQDNYCRKCGQRIDWSEVEDDK